MFFSFSSLAGAIFACFLLSDIVMGRSSSLAVDVRGHGVRFIDGPITSGNVGVTTSDNLGYFTNITLGGLNLTVILDTGSFDLIVDLQGHQLLLTNTTNIQTSQQFGNGNAIGDVNFAELRLGDFIIQSQAFLDATQFSEFGDIHGILGMSFNVDSPIRAAIAQAWGAQAAQIFGNTPMPALFAQDTTLSHNFDVQLARASELDTTAPGLFIIGTHDPDFASVTDAPHLPIVTSDHWSLVMDAMKINGKVFSFNTSRIAGVPVGKVAAALDTGFSLPPLPAPAVDAIYSDIPGAAFDERGQQWFVPCDASTNVSFVFAGQEFFVHPLDLTYPVTGSIGGVQRTVCVNTYQYLTLNPDAFTGFDLILGDAFLRNVYASFNYGTALFGNSGPFVQMVSTTTNMAEAMDEFKTQRAATLTHLPPVVDPSHAVHGLIDNSSTTIRSLCLGNSRVSLVLLSIVFLL
ncbi:acid protease [Trametes gibbosa]|nr:acid protease [Trametes gibbosa]